MTSLEIGGAGRSGPGVLEASISRCQEQAGPGVVAMSAHAYRAYCPVRLADAPALR